MAVALARRGGKIDAHANFGRSPKTTADVDHALVRAGDIGLFLIIINQLCGRLNALLETRYDTADNKHNHNRAWGVGS